MAGIIKDSKNPIRTLDWNKMCEPIVTYQPAYLTKASWLEKERKELFDDINKLAELYKIGQIEKDIFIGIVSGMIAVLVEREVERGIGNYFEEYLHSSICSRVTNILGKAFATHRK